MFIDESWFVLWPYPTQTWAKRGLPYRIAKAKDWKRGRRPPSCALYAGMDTVSHEVSGRWHETWNQDETWTFLQEVFATYERRGIRYLVVFWDNAPWHVAASVRQRVAERNREAKRKGGIRILLYYLPIKAPWLMPLEPVFGQTKRAVGAAKRDDIADLKSAVEGRLSRRNALVKSRQHTITRSVECVSII